MSGIQARTENLNKNEQEEVYNEIDRVYALVDNILVTIQESGPGDAPPEEQLKIARPVIEQMTESADIVGEKYIEWIENDQNASRQDVNTVETAIRKVFTKCTDFINNVTEIGKKASTTIKKAGKNVVSVIEQVESVILPRIGSRVGELIHGPVGLSYLEQIAENESYKKLLRSIKLAMDHFFRLTYCFVSLKNGLVTNPHNVIWGRHVPDLQAQAMLEKHKADIKKQNLMVQTRSFTDLISRDGFSRSAT